MHFPPGKTPLLILLLAMLGSLGLLLHRGPRSQADQTAWVFDASHADTYRLSTNAQEPLTTLYRQQTGRSVAIKLMPSRVLDARLLCLILGNVQSAEVPDLVEIEIGSVGKYFRAKPEENGLYPLNRFIFNDPLASRLSPARLSAWTSGGQIFGIPRDVHPVTLSYRKDLFQQAGVDLAACTTWEQFREACLQYQRYWQTHGGTGAGDAGSAGVGGAGGQWRFAMQLSRWSASDLMILLNQQHIQFADDEGHPSLTDPRIARTIAFYAQLVAGEDRISSPVADDLIARDLADGRTACALTPDWRIAYLRFEPNLLGRMAMMPLPRFEPTDAPTASWGGTMVAIPRNCKDPEASWQLLRFLQLSPEAMRARQYHSSILPAVTSAWEEPIWDQPNPIFRGQPIGRLYAQLARELPIQHISPYSTLLSQSIAGVLAAAQAQLESSGPGPAGLEEFCQERLNRSQAELTKLLKFAEEQ